ncbi:MAG: phosphatase PAP2 family protein [Muribaculaceae bacterium]|nr:phosphatase PAP2 family protein [Muribaculaceae bacterium]
MKLDTSSYYPKSSIDDSAYMPASERPEGPEVDTSSAADTADNAPADEITAEETCQAPPAEEKVPDLPPTEFESALNWSAHLISWILVPVLMPVYATLFAFGYSELIFTSFKTRFLFIVIVALINTVIPILFGLMLKKMGIVKDIGLNNQKERFLPYVICILGLMGTALFMGFRGAPQWFVMFFLGGAAAGIVEVIVNRWWKISVHAAGVAGIIALQVYMLINQFTVPGLDGWLIATIITAGLLGSARVWLGRHTVAQVIAGYAVGFAGVYIMMLI